MIFKTDYRRQPEYAQGMRDQATVALGTAAWGLMTGVAMVNGGLSLIEALVMTLVVYAGSAQLAAVPLLTSGAPLWVVLAAAFCVNLRFVVFSLHMRPFVMHLPRSERLLTGYFTGDISYAFFARKYLRPGDSPTVLLQQQAYLAGSCAVNYAVWMVSSVAGVLMANVFPEEWGLGFAGTLALLGVGASLASSRLRVLSAAVAGTAALVAWALPFKLHIVFAIAAAVSTCLWVEARGPTWIQGAPVGTRRPRR